jgi:hypothetical protein
MEKIADLTIAFLDVVKADLAESKKGIFELGISLVLASVAGLFLVAAVALISYSLFLILSDLMEKDAAVLVTGLFYLLCGGLAIWLAKTKTAV